MRRWTAKVATMAAAATLPALAGCGEPPATLSVDGAWVRLGAVQGRPAAVYFTVHGGADAPATLIGVSTDIAIKAEMHESMKAGAMATTMRPIARVLIPANATVAFAPGGRHVMLFDVNRGIRPGSLIDISLTFADGTRLPRKATVVAAGDPAP